MAHGVGHLQSETFPSTYFTGAKANQTKAN